LSALTAMPMELEAERVESLRSYTILDTLPDPVFDDIAWMAARFCDTPTAMITLIDENRVWFKARVGTSADSAPRAGSFCEQTMLRKKFTVIPDASTDPHFAAHPLVPDTVRFYAGAPLLMPDGHVIGTLCIVDRQPRDLLEAQREALQALARQVVSLLTYRKQSVRDPLTGLFNRRHLIDALQRELHRAERRNEPVSLLLLYVDHFKHFNDSYGHAAGDQILRCLGEVFREHTRGADIVARYGGEEFAVVLPGTGMVEAAVCAENLRHMASRMSIAWEGRVLPQLTVSGGVAACPNDGREINGLINAADGALYRAKHGGRNRVLTTRQRSRTDPP